MKYLHNDEKQTAEATSFLFSPAVKPLFPSKKLLAGFAKVLVNGRVVGVDYNKPFHARMIGDCMGDQAPGSDIVNGEALLEAVAANLEAGMRLLDKQELVLAKLGGRLSEVALALNQSREFEDKQDDAQDRFILARDHIRKLVKSTFDHTTLFSNGPSEPIAVAVPTLGTWEGLSINRCDISTPGLKSVDVGKVVPREYGLLLEPASVELSFSEWRKLCIHNRLQWSLLSERLYQVTHPMMQSARNGLWRSPDFPEQLPDGPLRRPHRNN